MDQKEALSKFHRKESVKSCKEVLLKIPNLAELLDLYLKSPDFNNELKASDYGGVTSGKIVFFRTAYKLFDLLKCNNK